MSLIRDYFLVGLGAGESKVINVVGRTIVVRREIGAGRVRVVTFAHDGQLVSDNTMQAGEKIETDKRFQRLEITNLESDSRNVHVTAGAGDFQSDIVEGNVTVSTDPSNPIATVGGATHSKSEVSEITNVASNIAITSPTSIMLFADGAMLFSVSDSQIAPHIPLAKGQSITLSVSPPDVLTVAAEGADPINLYVVKQGTKV